MEKAFRAIVMLITLSAGQFLVACAEQHNIGEPVSVGISPEQRVAQPTSDQKSLGTVGGN